MPSWLVPIINGPTRRTARHVASGHTSAPGSTSGDTSGTSGVTSGTTTRGSTGESTYEPRPFELAVVHDLFRKASKSFAKSCEEGDATSVYSSSKSWSPYLVAHHYYTGVGGRRCPFDGPLHESDNLCLLVRGCRLFFTNAILHRAVKSTLSWIIADVLEPSYPFFLAMFLFRARRRMRYTEVLACVRKKQLKPRDQVMQRMPLTTTMLLYQHLF